jgi:vacuolar-type H+-ATPase subunit D/Vma8
LEDAVLLGWKVVNELEEKEEALSTSKDRLARTKRNVNLLEKVYEK